MKGSLSLAMAGTAPQKIPSGTPMTDETKKPQKMTWMLCQRLSCSHGSSGRSGLVVNPVTIARTTSCGAGKKHRVGPRASGGSPTARDDLCIGRVEPLRFDQEVRRHPVDVARIG